MDLGNRTESSFNFPTSFFLTAIAGVPTIVCSLYCLFVWAPMQDNFSWFNLDISLICWTFCSTGIPALAYVAVMAGLASIVGGCVVERSTVGQYLIIFSGILLLPLGFLNFIVLARLRSHQPH